MASEERGGLVQDLVEEVGLVAIAGEHLLESADLIPEPAGDEHHDVDREDRRRVVAGAVLDVGPVVKGRREAVRDAIEQVVPDDDHGDAGRPRVLLRPRVQEPVTRDVDRSRQEVRRDVGDQGHVVGDDRGR